jgi:hypothetical protein
MCIRTAICCVLVFSCERAPLYSCPIVRKDCAVRQLNVRGAFKTEELPLSLREVTESHGYACAAASEVLGARKV